MLVYQRVCHKICQDLRRLAAALGGTGDRHFHDGHVRAGCVTCPRCRMLGLSPQRSWGSAASQVQYPDDPDVSKLSFLAGWNLELFHNAVENNADGLPKY